MIKGDQSKMDHGVQGGAIDSNVVLLQRRESFEKIIQEVEDFLEYKSNSTAAVAASDNHPV